MRKQWMPLLAAVLALTVLCAGAQAEKAQPTAYAQYLETGEYPSLKEHYQDQFLIGAAVTPDLVQNEETASVIARQFSSLTCENEMKPDFTLSWADTRYGGDADRAVVRPTQAKAVLSFAQANGIKVRAHTLIWHSQTPRWFFTEGWEKSEHAKLADRDTMLRRMENYIHDMMDWVNANYPGVVYAWDVVNEAIEVGNGHPEGLRTENNLWYETVGDDWVEWAFAFARMYAAPDQKLFYNDYGCVDSIKYGRLRPLLKKLKEMGVVDGLGMQCHLGLEDPSASDLETKITSYAKLGLTIHITELDIGTEDGSLLGQMKLAVRYRSLFSLLQRLKDRAGLDIESVTFWGLTDDRSWLNSENSAKYPLLFDRNLNPKSAFFGVLQDGSIPYKNDETLMQEAIDQLGLKPYETREDGDVNVYKTLSQHNPTVTHKFGADPWAMVYQDRVYLYMTGDEPVMGADGSVQTNTYGNINTLRVISSDDLVNWQDHGEVKAAGRNGAAKWAANSWAPCAAWKNIDGQDRFFLYFANSGGGIGVLTADSPTGPFTDPLGKPLISRSTPTCAEVTWLFDPAVLVDDDGEAYLYFGGGIPDGKAESPQTARAVKLGKDMISLDGDPVRLDPPWLFEDSGINKIGDTYLYSYCSNFNVPAGGSSQGFYSGEIVYMTSDAPLGPYTYAGRVLKNPGSYFGVGGNNHHSMFQFQGEWYIAYHAATVDRDMGWNAGYRSTFIDRLALNEAGLPTLSQGTMAGVDQRKAFDPYKLTEAETFAAVAGAQVDALPDAAAGQAVKSSATGGWMGVAGVDFGDEGAAAVTFQWQSAAGGVLSLIADDLNNAPFAQIELPAGGDWQKMLFALPETIQGRHDLYIRFEAPGILLDQWQFHLASEVVTGPALLTASDFPDVSVIRRDDTYYMASTTMHFSPGCVILRSYDLIQWEIVGRVFDAVDDQPMRALQNGENCYGKGMWAPSLRWHDGLYYLCFTAADSHATYVYTTKDIENGPWEKRVIAGYYHDPSLFFDTDGKAYIAWGNTEIRLAELKDDLSGPKPGGLDRVVARSDVAPMLGYEGSHLEKVGDVYCLFLIHSLKDQWKRVETCLTSDSLTGEFTGGVVLNDDMGYRGSGVAQGGIVDTPDGRWFAILFQDRGAVGRVPVLVPVTWDHGAPVLGVNGKVPAQAVNLSTRPGHVYQPLTGNDGFSSDTLNAMWEWNHLPDNDAWQVGGGRLIIRSAGVEENLTQVRNMLTLRGTWPNCEVTVRVDGSGLSEGDRAGLCALQANWITAFLTKKDGEYLIAIQEQGKEAEEKLACGPEVTLKMAFDFFNMRDTVNCFALADGEWVPLNRQPHGVSFDLSHFAGVRPALFLQSTANAGGQAAFSDFTYVVGEAK